mmetsp:Transcript_1428/g.3448  ORF Transcript_1428/g.3448 Transcript_1428/m.3448 type:complete len:251 (+) Transcript_1428:37-789(+)
MLATPSSSSSSVKEIAKAALFLTAGALVGALVVASVKGSALTVATPFPTASLDLLGNGPGGGAPFAINEIVGTYDKDVMIKTVQDFRAKFDDVEPGKVYGTAPYGKNCAVSGEHLMKGCKIEPGLSMKVRTPEGKDMMLNTVFFSLKPGYSFGVHAHPFSGVACVSGGAFRLFFEDPFGAGQLESGQEGVLRQGGNCYTFPANVKMWLINEGDTEVTTHDQMLVPMEWGSQYFTLIEPDALPFWHSLGLP